MPVCFFPFQPETNLPFTKTGYVLHWTEFYLGCLTLVHDFSNSLEVRLFGNATCARANIFLLWISSVPQLHILVIHNSSKFEIPRECIWGETRGFPTSVVGTHLIWLKVCPRRMRESCFPPCAPQAQPSQDPSMPMCVPPGPPVDELRQGCMPLKTNISQPKSGETMLPSARLC